MGWRKCFGSGGVRVYHYAPATSSDPTLHTRTLPGMTVFKPPPCPIITAKAGMEDIVKIEVETIPSGSHDFPFSTSSRAPALASPRSLTKNTRAAVYVNPSPATDVPDAPPVKVTRRIKYQEVRARLLVDWRCYWIPPKTQFECRRRYKGEQEWKSQR